MGVTIESFVLAEIAEVLAAEYSRDLAGDHNISIPDLAQKIADKLHLEGQERVRWYERCNITERPF